VGLVLAPGSRPVLDTGYTPRSPVARGGLRASLLVQFIRFTVIDDYTCQKKPPLDAFYLAVPSCWKNSKAIACNGAIFWTLQVERMRCAKGSVPSGAKTVCLKQVLNLRSATVSAWKQRFAGCAGSRRCYLDLQSMLPQQMQDRSYEGILERDLRAVFEGCITHHRLSIAKGGQATNGQAHRAPRV